MTDTHHNRHLLGNRPKILVDYRENSCKLPGHLKTAGFDLTIKKLPYCDYVINQEIFIERKTARDFVISIIDGRLFEQARRMKQLLSRPLYLVEGNPLNSKINISKDAVMGAAVSLQAIWQVPTIFSDDVKQSCHIISMIFHQSNKLPNLVKLRHGYRPKKLRSRKLHFLQGLPQVGPQIAKRLLDHFKSVQNALNASEKDLLKIHGIGKKKAMLIKKVLT
jgi:Fanconi anemia group M protein